MFYIWFWRRLERRIGKWSLSHKSGCVFHMRYGAIVAEDMVRSILDRELFDIMKYVEVLYEFGTSKLGSFWSIVSMIFPRLF